MAPEDLLKTGGRSCSLVTLSLAAGRDVWYVQGLGVAQNTNQALTSYRWAATTRIRTLKEPCCPWAATTAEGRLVAKDLPQAADWYKKAAARGNAEAKKALENTEFGAYR